LRKEARRHSSFVSNAIRAEKLAYERLCLRCVPRTDTADGKPFESWIWK
jgi:hypothetical protein